MGCIIDVCSIVLIELRALRIVLQHVLAHEVLSLFLLGIRRVVVAQKVLVLLDALLPQNVFLIGMRRGVCSTTRHLTKYPMGG